VGRCGSVGLKGRAKRQVTALQSVERDTSATRILTSAAQLGNRAAKAGCIRRSQVPRAVLHPLWNGVKIVSMAKLTLVYGMRLLPSEEIEEVGEAQVKLKNGRDARVTLHIVEGSKDDIEKQLRQSIDAFFDLYPEI